jgi:hypothetical protein
MAITDIAPNYTGSVLAVLNTISNCIGFIAPVVTAAIVDGNVSYKNRMYI